MVEHMFGDIEASTGSGMSNTNTQISRLREELATYGVRYPIADYLDDIDQLEATIARRSQHQMELRHQTKLRHQVDMLQSRVGELEDERRVLDSEIGELERALETLIEETLDRVRTEFGEAWSPRPIVGFRGWRVGTDGLYGIKERWTSRQLEARCLRRAPELDIPHAEWVCGSPPCGIYATKDPQAASAWVRTFDPGAVGMVALSGKVVEHERGYRAARAEVVALAIEGAGDLITADNADEIDRLFQQQYQWEPWEWPPGTICVLRRRRSLDQATAHIKEQARRREYGHWPTGQSDHRRARGRSNPR